MPPHFVPPAAHAVPPFAHPCPDMHTAISPGEAAAAEPAVNRRGLVVGFLLAALEGVVLLLVLVSPWAFGAVHPLFELGVFALVALVTLLWAARLLLEWRVPSVRPPVT